MNYDENIPLLVNKCEENIHCPKADVHQGSYVGANTCKACHAQAFLIWEHMQYSRVRDLMKQATKSRDNSATAKHGKRLWIKTKIAIVPALAVIASDLWKKVAIARSQMSDRLKTCNANHAMVREAFMRKAAKKT